MFVLSFVSLGAGSRGFSEIRAKTSTSGAVVRWDRMNSDAGEHGDNGALGMLQRRRDMT
jgi:hypothetical protein